MNNLVNLVDEFKQKYYPSFKEEIKFYKTRTNLEDAVRIASLAKMPDGRMHSHQRRVGKQKLELLHKYLLNKIDEIRNCRTFDCLLQIVGNCDIRGIRDLTIYDTAFRIGVFLSIYPDNIYLHTGTRIGAINLLGKIKIGSRPFVTKSELPMDLQILEPWEIETFLCCMAGKLQETGLESGILS